MHVMQDNTIVRWAMITRHNFSFARFFFTSSQGYIIALGRCSSVYSGICWKDTLTFLVHLDVFGAKKGNLHGFCSVYRFLVQMVLLRLWRNSVPLFCYFHIFRTNIFTSPCFAQIIDYQWSLIFSTSMFVFNIVHLYIWTNLMPF